MSRKPDGRSQLNRLSPDRQAAVADYYEQAYKIIGADPGEPTNTTNPCQDQCHSEIQAGLRPGGTPRQ